MVATRREAWSAVEADFPQAPAAEGIARMPPLDRVRWTHAYDMRFVQGPLQINTPSVDERDSVSLLWGPGGELLTVTHQIVYYKE